VLITHKVMLVTSGNKMVHTYTFTNSFLHESPLYMSTNYYMYAG